MALTRDAPLYLEWAPDNILSQNPMAGNVKDEKVVGESDAKRVLLEQAVEGLLDVELDPDRVEVCPDGPFSCFFPFSLLFIHCDG